MELDHIFIMSQPGGEPWLTPLLEKGLIETYQRVHQGQGTANRCFAFDNAFLELLWLTDTDAARAPAIARTRLYERATGGCSIGIAWRGETDPRIKYWDYGPPYLPPGLSIPVAIASDDPHLPMLFQSPGRQAPEAWPKERRGVLQHPAGFSRLEVILYAKEPTALAIRVLAERNVCTVVPSDRWGIEIQGMDVHGEAHRLLFRH